MVEYWKYIGTMQLPADLPTGVLDEWKATLKAEQARIYSSLLTKIPNEALFQNRIADASADVFEQFVSGVGAPWDKDVIAMKQRVKLYRKYTDWDAGIDACFGVGGYFPNRVDSKADKFKLARYVMGVVGHRASPSAPYGTWNPATMGVLLLRGDTRCSRYFDANDSFAGTLETVCDAVKGRLMSPPMLAHTIFASVMAKFAEEGGLSALRGTIITNANAVLDALLQVALNTAHLTPPKDVTFVLDWNAADANVRLTVTDIH